MIFQLIEIGDFFDSSLQLLFQLFHVVFVDDEIFARADHIAADLFGGSGGIFEISAYGFLNLFAGIHQP